MRKILGTIALLAIAFGVIGFFRGWFMLQANSDSNRTNIEMSIDKERLHQDMDRVKETVHGLSGKDRWINA